MNRPKGHGCAICLLGEVRMVTPTGPVASRSAFSRTMLALLAVRAGEVVATDTLIDELWGEELPADPKGALQIQVTRLRKWLAVGGDSAPSLSHEQDGYRLHIEPTAVDLIAFLSAAADALGHDEMAPTERLKHCDAALARYSGEPFMGCARTLRLESERLRAEELNLQVAERRAASLLELDEVNEAIAYLMPLVSHHRAREQLTASLMVALYRAGRAHDALQSYEETREYLIEEYGLDVSRQLAALQSKILVQDDSLQPTTRAGRTRTAGQRPLIIDREQILERLHPHREGPGRIVVLTGEAGIGKSTILAAALHDAVADGALVGAGRWDDSGAPLAGWDEAMADLGLVPLSASRAERGATAGRAVRSMLARVALDAPLLLTLDDIHLADSISLGVVRGLARLGLPRGVTLALAARTPDTIARPQWTAALADIARSTLVEQCEVEALTAAGVAAVVKAKVPDAGSEETSRLAELLWTSTSGHPLHLDALLDGMSGLPDESSRLASTMMVPDQLQPLLAHQLQHLPRACRDLLEVLAILGTAPIEEVAALGHVGDPLAAARELRPAFELGILREDGDRLAFRHALTALAVLETTSHPVAARLHFERYENLVATGADPFEVLRHALGAGHVLAPSALALARLAAGRAAYARGAHEEAASLLAAALPDAPRGELPQVALLQGLNLAALGHVDEANELLGAVVDDAAASAATRVVAAVGHEPLGLSVAGDGARLDRLRRAIHLADEVEPWAAIDLVRALIVEESLVEGAAPHRDLAQRLQQLVAAATDGGRSLDPVAYARLQVLGARGDVDAPVPATRRVATAEAAFEAATASGDPVLRLEATEFLLSASLAAGRIDRAEDLRWLLQREAAQANRPRSIWAADLVAASLAMAAGRAEEADTIANKTLERGLELGIPDAFGAYGVHLAARHLLGGNLSEISSLIDQATEIYPLIAAWPAAAAVAAVHGGDRAGAELALAEFAARRAATASRYFDRTALALAATAAAGLGNIEAARIVVGSLNPDPDAVIVVGVGAGIFGPANLYVARAEATLGLQDAAWDHAHQALDLASRLGWGPWEKEASALVHALSD